MGNFYVSKMKSAMRHFYEVQKKAAAEMVSNNERLNPDFAAEANAVIQQRIDTALYTARQQINGIFEDVRSCLGAASFLNSENMTADTMFFTGDFDLSAADVQLFIQRYESNPTMLRYIKSWTDRENAAAAADGMSKKYDVKIHLPEEQLQTYQQFSEGALSLIDKIYVGVATETELDYFGDENFSATLYDVIGSGEHLSSYKGQRNIPEAAKHLYDDATLTSSQNSNIYVG